MPTEELENTEAGIGGDPLPKPLPKQGPRPIAVPREEFDTTLASTNQALISVVAEVELHSITQWPKDRAQITAKAIDLVGLWRQALDQEWDDKKDVADGIVSQLNRLIRLVAVKEREHYEAVHSK